jgi:hypothetical protein
MSEVQMLEDRANKRIRELRKQKLSQGIPFMINCNSLPSHKCYLEYPDGAIKLVTLSGKGCDFDIVRSLNSRERKRLRHKYNLDSIAP